MARSSNRGYGRGTIEKRKGRFRARVPANGGKITLGTYDTEEEAEGAIAVFLEAASTRSPVAGETLATWGERWLDARETDGVHRSVDRDRYSFTRVERATISKLELAAITPHDVRDWIAEQIKTGAAKQTIQNSLSLMRVCLEAACQARKIESNPAHGVKVPKMARRDDPWTWLTAAEIERLLKPDDDGSIPEIRDTIAFAIYTGMRAGEVFGLRWRDVGPKTIAVRHSWRDTATKTGKVRRVQLLRPVRDVLRRQRERAGDSEFVFPNPDSSPRSRDQQPSIEGELRRAEIARENIRKNLHVQRAEQRAEEAGEDRDVEDKAGVRFHDLRHTCASHLLMGTWAPACLARALTLPEVGSWLGHASYVSTQRYAHLCPGGLASLVVHDEETDAPSARRRGEQRDERGSVKLRLKRTQESDPDRPRRTRTETQNG